MSVSLSYRNLGIDFLSLGKIKDNLSKSPGSPGKV